MNPSSNCTRARSPLDAPRVARPLERSQTLRAELLRGPVRNHLRAREGGWLACKDVFALRLAQKICPVLSKIYWTILSNRSRMVKPIPVEARRPDELTLGASRPSRFWSPGPRQLPPGEGAFDNQPRAPGSNSPKQTSNGYRPELGKSNEGQNASQSAPNKRNIWDA